MPNLRRHAAHRGLLHLLLCSQKARYHEESNRQPAEHIFGLEQIRRNKKVDAGKAHARHLLVMVQHDTGRRKGFQQIQADAAAARRLSPHAG